MLARLCLDLIRRAADAAAAAAQGSGALCCGAGMLQDDRLAFDPQPDAVLNRDVRHRGPCAGGQPVLLTLVLSGAGVGARAL